MTDPRRRARGTLALGAAVSLVAAGALAWVAIAGDDAWHGGEPGVVMTPAAPGDSTASTPSPLPIGPEPVFPAPQQTPAPTGTHGGSDPTPTDDGGGQQQGTDAPGSGSPGSGSPGSGSPGSGSPGSRSPGGGSPGGGVQSGQPASGQGR